MTDKIKEFYNFLNKCKRYDIRLKSVKYNEEFKCFTYHFCKMKFLGNNIYFCDNDYWVQVNETVATNLDNLYDSIINCVCKRYGLKKD